MATTAATIQDVLSELSEDESVAFMRGLRISQAVQLLSEREQRVTLLRALQEHDPTAWRAFVSVLGRSFYRTVHAEQAAGS